MQFYIKDFYDSEDRYLTRSLDHLLFWEKDSILIKQGSRYSGKFKVLYEIPLEGWFNIQFNPDKYIMDSGKYVSVETDILTIQGSDYLIRNYKFAFIPMQTHSLRAFLRTLVEIDERNTKDNLSKAIDILGIKESQLLRKQLEEKLGIAERLKQFKLKKEQEVKEKEEEERERNARMNKLSLTDRFFATVQQTKDNYEIERLFLNYLQKYAKGKFLAATDYISFSYYITNKNGFYEQVKECLPSLGTAREKKERIGYTFELEKADKLVEYINRTMNVENVGFAKLLTWAELCYATELFYAKDFARLYGRQINDIKELSLEDSIMRYIDSAIISYGGNVHGMFIYYLMSMKKFELEDYKKGYINCKEIFNKIYGRLKNENDFNTFVNSLIGNEDDRGKTYSIDDVDLMSGAEFENFISILFNKMGFITRITKATGDQGIDVIAEKDELKYGIQAKCYSSQVSNSAIQEVVAGAAFYNCNKAIVVTNNYFTGSAKELADANGVILWDREMIKNKIEELFY